MWMDSDHIGGHNFLLDGWPVVRCWRGGCASKVKTMAWIPWTGCGGTFSVVSFLKEHFL
uniref:Uncharacterized protein n=1 Tax=Oryza sativa subsp. japonica TaxID=39947 RepID=Q33B75_ORYSJ|nr:hypothetical protein LOC_Os10g04500 [Oryza sativa Japonica Group]